MNSLACVAGGILMPGELFLAAEPRGKIGHQVDLYAHPSRGSAAKTIGSFNIDDGNCSENVSVKRETSALK